MSKDKYPSIFSREMAIIVYIYVASYVGRKSEAKKCLYYLSLLFFNLFRNARSFENWGIFSDIPQFWLGNIRSRDAFRPIARKQKDLMDYNAEYLLSTDDRYREHHDHIWIVLQFVE